MKLTNSKIKSFLETENSEYRNSILNDSSFDEFDQDVMDGLSNSDIVSSNFKNLDKKYYRFSFSKVILSISLIVIITSAIYFLQTPKKNSQKIFDNQERLINRQEKSITKKNLNDKKEVEIEHSLDLGKNNPVENKKEVQKALSLSIENPTGKQTYTEQTGSSMSTLNPKILNNSKGIVGKQGAEVYILDYKTLDYREYRKKSVKTSDPLSLTNGTPANSSEKNQNNIENQEIEYNYFNYLNESMKLFDKKMYSSALDNFNAILNTYSDDINALFYGGLCLFELNKYKESILLFEQVSKSSFINFKEEGEWFLLQSYLETNEIEKAKLLRNEIINRNGFYAKSAKELKIN